MIKRHYNLSFATIGIGLLVAIQPLLLGCLPKSDAVLHLYRLSQLERCLLHGTLYPRWLPDLGLGFGFPLFNYYAPLSYYLALPLQALGFSLEATLMGGFALAHILLVLGTFLWTRDLFGEEAALIAAFAISYAPYQLLDIHYRGAYAEVWGLAWLSLSLWAIHRLISRGGKGPLLLTTLCYTALILSHNIMALVGTPLLLGYALFLIWLYHRRGWAALYPLLSLSLGLGISAFFWLPALLEQNYVQIYQIQIYNYYEYFLTLKELFAGPHPTDPAEMISHVPYSVGWIMPFLALLGWCFTHKYLPREARAQQVVLTAMCVGFTIMPLPLSTPLWEHVPLLSFLQFPWRFLGPLSLGLAILAGVGASRLPGPSNLWPPLLLGIMIVFAFTWIFPPCGRAQPPLTPPNLIRIEGKTGQLGATAAGDYLPRQVEERPTAETLLAVYESAAPDYIIPRLDPSSLPENATVLKADYDLTEAQLTLASDAAFRARFRWYYFPGWQAWIDNKPAPVNYDGPHGLLAVDVPAGQHELHVAFGDTPLRRNATRLSLASLLTFGMLIWLTKPITKSDAHPAPPDTHHAKHNTQYITFGSCLLVSLALFTVKTSYLDHVDNPLRPHNFDGQTVRGVEIPLQVDFGHQLVLMGYDLPAASLSSDQATALTLYWRTLPPIETDYSVALHLVDEQGRLYGQIDHQHPGGYPTARLLPSEYIRDEYMLTAFLGTPPGTYTLVASVYDVATDHTLNVWDAGGGWQGIAYPLAQVQVTQPRAFPAPEDLPITYHVLADLSDNLRLLGSNALTNIIQVGQRLPLTLFWQATAAPDADAQVCYQLISGEGDIVAETIAPPGQADHPTSTWLPGEVIRDGQAFLVPAARLDDTTQPLTSGQYTLRVSLVENGSTLPTSIDLGTLTIQAPERDFAIPEVANAVNARLGDRATLVGYEIDTTRTTPGTSFTLTLTWQAESLSDTAYTVFIHLLDAEEHIYAQCDMPPLAGTRPTTSWLPGEMLRDTYTLTANANTPPGTYWLKVGLYDPATNIRLPVTDAGGQPVGDAVTLPTTIQITTIDE